MEFIVAVLLSYSNSKYFLFTFLNFFLVAFFFNCFFFSLTYVPLLYLLRPAIPPLPPIVRGGFFYAP